ncbi:hypothetical protein BN946_scf185008.g104 [Trametes cinnabarina]|uniref:Uncharacterized protein n=1 Tax=Pycnoporus cinnabarinus TaxID=5643 RepID=A0A060SGP8_PYCCI|nr:hypothetical protein BN946_scf185008.g104 [Trametes cinnabarina]
MPAPPAPLPPQNAPQNTPLNAPQPQSVVAPSSSRAPQLNQAKLNAVVTAVEEVNVEIREMKESSEKRDKVLYSVIKVLKARLSKAEAELLALKEDLGLDELEEEEDAEEGRQGAGSRASDPAGEQTREGMLRPTPAEIKHSEEVTKGAHIKLVINTAFKKLMGVTKLTGPELPVWPHGITEEDAAWPRDSHGGRNPLLRFKWNEPETSRTNDAGLKKVLMWIQASGRTAIPHAADDLDDALEYDLMQRVQYRWGYLRKEARKHERATVASRTAGGGRTSSPSVYDGDAVGGGGQSAEEDEGNAPAGCQDGSSGPNDGSNGNERAGGEAAPVPKAPSGTKRQILSSRAKGKAAQRSRKRVGSQYEDPKYDAAFLVNAMSDDEDDEDSPFVDRKATGYVSRAPGYRSQIVQELYDHIDACKDPHPDKDRAMVPRVRGSAKLDAAPPRANKLSSRIRAWQVNAAYLEDHPDWLVTGRVAASGKAWGDLEDPQEDEKPGKKKAGDTERARRKKIRRVENAADMAEAQAELERVAEGLDVDSLFGQQ